MRSVIAVHPDFDGIWPLAADHFHRLWQAQGPVEFYRLAPEDRRPIGQIVESPGTVTRLVVLSVPVTNDCTEVLTGLREAALLAAIPDSVREHLAARGVRLYSHNSQGFWAQSVAECALTLTLNSLRRIPLLHSQTIGDTSVWDYNPPGGVGRPGARGQQYGDDPNFVSGTVAGKRVRIVGAGNIATRYASWCHAMGADVAAWDPFASEPNFHRTGARREWHLSELVKDADIFAPMVPLMEGTHGLVTAAHSAALPKGALVVLVTRAGIVDMAALRRRVLADELALAADVFDVEPLPLDDPLLGRHNVVHTPHIAGRTADANRQYATDIVVQFLPYEGAI